MHRRLVNHKYAAARRPRGRPKTTASARTLIIGMARENPRWGHRRIQGELQKLGFQIAHSTVWEVLNNAGIDPSVLTPEGLRIRVPDYLGGMDPATPDISPIFADLSRMAQVFVTGGSGFIGQVLVRRLLDGGNSVRVLVRSEASAEKVATLGAEAVRGN